MSPSKSNPKPDERAWLLPACLGLMTRGAAFHLVEWGARNGLSLIADYLDRPRLVSPAGEVLPGPEEYPRNPYPVLSRTGLGPEAGPPPEEPALWLQLAREASGPRLERLSWADSERLLAERWTPGEAEGLVVFSPLAGVPAGLAAILEPWGDLGFWVEWRLGPGGTAELAVHRFVEGELRTAVLGRAEAVGLTVLPGWNFLNRPFGPASRHTIEEPPRKMK